MALGAANELVLAASSVPQVDGDVYRYHHTPARNFAWTVSDQYQVLETARSALDSLG